MPRCFSIIFVFWDYLASCSLCFYDLCFVVCQFLKILGHCFFCPILFLFSCDFNYTFRPSDIISKLNDILFYFFTVFFPLHFSLDYLYWPIFKFKDSFRGYAKFTDELIEDLLCLLLCFSFLEFSFDFLIMFISLLKYPT